jgi:hypothetical protein
MESPNRQMWGDRVSLGLLLPTRRAQSNLGLLCFRRWGVCYAISVSCRARRHRRGRKILKRGFSPQDCNVYALLPRCPRSWQNPVWFDELTGILLFYHGTTMGYPVFPRRVFRWTSPFRRMIQTHMSLFRRKILRRENELSERSGREVSSFCRIIGDSRPPFSDGAAGFARESETPSAGQTSLFCQCDAAFPPFSEARRWAALYKNK